ncbi:MAG: hypothetical protein ACLSDM_00765 [Butyricicoccus sp.]
MKIEQQNQILGCMNDVLNQNGFRAEIMQKDGAPTILRCEAMRQGKVAKDVVIEACFIPMQLPAEDMGLLQFFVTLFQGAPENNKVQLRHACDYCNNFCALGSFGFFEGRSDLPQAQHIGRRLSRARENHSVCGGQHFRVDRGSLFIDGLAQIAYAGGRSTLLLSRICSQSSANCNKTPQSLALRRVSRNCSSASSRQ